MTRPANSLRQRRERLGYSQQALGTLVGVDAKTIRNWETGERVPRLKNRRPLGDALGLDLDELQVLIAEIEADHVECLAGRSTPSGTGGVAPPDAGAPR